MTQSGKKGPVFADTATSPDGRFIARVEQTQDFRGMFHEDMAWDIEVRDAAGDRVFKTSRSWSGYVDDTDDHRASGVQVRGVAFTPDGRLLIGIYNHDPETVSLPPPLLVPARLALEACTAALRAAYPDRWQQVADGVESLLWPRAEDCAVCSRQPGKMVCKSCRSLCDRRVRSKAFLDPSMVLAETLRALHAQEAGSPDLVATLDAQAARVRNEDPCSLCGKTLRDLGDLRSPAGRVCAPCVEATASR